ncbi:MAG: polymer-forming cytoskeletal protein [Alphaproteobacteria bacterium]|nr:polymer-forming cytoskeletal protein [Alphaproteobacteria bacterium]MBV8549359.1 polymer-forming cytoskeletal protein [Alphaproteobacteria bacterium]
MFGRKGAEGAENEVQETVNESGSTLSRAPEQAPRTGVAMPSPARRVVEIPGATRRNSNASAEERRLTVGKGLSLAGEITSCDILVVEGKVEAKLTDGKLLEITESGQFRGSVEIENADIAGRYDGNLIVHGRLTVRTTGRISGMVKYGELEVSAGGQIIGEMQVTGGGVQERGNGFKNAAKSTAGSDEDEDSKKSA